jgi:hypothetical protein
MRMQDALYVGIGYETREPIVLCQCDLATSFPQLRLDELQTESGVNLLLLPSNNLPAPM